MTDAEKLRALADWFDATRPGGGDEVQRDLRRIADAVDRWVPKITVQSGRAINALKPNT